MNEIAQFKKILDELLELKYRKSKDYSGSWKMFGLEGIMYQVMNKSMRIWNLRKREPENESLRDSYIDLAVYAIMACQLIDNKETEPQI